MSATNPASEAIARKSAAKSPAVKRPAAAKAPQDRKPAATAETEAKGVKSHPVELDGRTWELDGSAFEDFEFVGYLAEIDAGSKDSVLLSTRALRRLLGDRQHSEALASLREEGVGVTLEAGIGFLMSLLQGFSPNS